MSETKHTPGPWVAENSSVIGPDNKIICGCIRGSIDRKSHEEDCATARLIAAAPDLLEALQRMIALDPPLTGNPSHSALVKFWQYEREQGNGAAETQLFALAAIAAATGATP